MAIFPGHYIASTFPLKGRGPEGDNPESVLFRGDGQAQGGHDGSHVAQQALGPESCSPELSQQDGTARVQVSLVVPHELEVLGQGQEGPLGMAQPLPVTQGMPGLEGDGSRRQAAELKLGG